MVLLTTILKKTNGGYELDKKELKNSHLLYRDDLKDWKNNEIVGHADWGWLLKEKKSRVISFVFGVLRAIPTGLPEFLEIVNVLDLNTLIL